MNLNYDFTSSCPYLKVQSIFRIDHEARDGWVNLKQRQAQLLYRPFVNRNTPGFTLQFISRKVKNQAMWSRQSNSLWDKRCADSDLDRETIRLRNNCDASNNCRHRRGGVGCNVRVLPPARNTGSQTKASQNEIQSCGVLRLHGIYPVFSPLSHCTVRRSNVLNTQ